MPQPEEQARKIIDQKLEDGCQFIPEQLECLGMIKDHIAASVTIEVDAFEEVPFNQKGGAIKVYELFGVELDRILEVLVDMFAADGKDGFVTHPYPVSGVPSLL